MALLECPNCGRMLSDKAIKCPHCGTAIKYGTLTILHKKNNIFVLEPFANIQRITFTLDGNLIEKIGSGSFIKGEKIIQPIKRDRTRIGVKIGMYRDNVECVFEKGVNYICTLSYSKIWGCFSCEITTDKGIIIHRQGISKTNKSKLILFAILYTILLIIFVNIYKLWH